MWKRFAQHSKLLGGIFLMSLFSQSAGTAADLSKFPDPAVDETAAGGKQVAVLAGGCFWCTEAVYEQLDGVSKVVSGYSGGTADTASYDIVSMGRSDHAEAIEITYDPSKTSYGEILKVFFSIAHDPTQLNRQGPDHGRQYRSAIFYANEEQKKVATTYIAQLEKAKVFSDPIVTEVVPLEKFYEAEEYHQDFVQRNPRQGYVVVNALPKVEKLKKNYPDKLR
jgi:peptide-methionine (S)-S-oxide reductase